MDIDLLIKKVYQNPPIWNKNHKLYTSRFAVDKAWLDIGEEMGISEVKLRKKWKYLRDQFSVEYGMALKGARESKWPHYHALMFLKDVIKPRTLFKRRLVDESNASSAADDHKHGEASSGRTREASANNDEDSQSSSTAPNDDKGPPTPAVRPKREKVSDSKPATADGFYGSSNKGPALSSGSSSMHQGRVSFGRRDPYVESDDLLFFKSLLPHVERLPPRAKLQFRMQVLRVVDDFVYSGATRTAPNGEVVMAETVYSSDESDQSDTPPPPSSPPPSRSKRK